MLFYFYAAAFPPCNSNFHPFALAVVCSAVRVQLMSDSATLCGVICLLLGQASPAASI